MNSNAIAAKRKVDSAFMKKGVFIAIMSGVTYGLYTGFLTLGMARGVWAADWYGANTSGLSVFAITCQYKKRPHTTFVICSPFQSSIL